jgi:hypothetical protein
MLRRALPARLSQEPYVVFKTICARFFGGRTVALRDDRQSLDRFYEEFGPRSSIGIKQPCALAV